MPVYYSIRGLSPEKKARVLWVDDYISFAECDILPKELAVLGFKTYFNTDKEGRKTVTGVGGFDEYFKLLRDKFEAALEEVVEKYPTSFTCTEELSTYLRSDLWWSDYPDDVTYLLSESWAAGYSKVMSTPTVQVNGLDSTEENEDVDAAKKRREVRLQLLGKLRPFPLQYVYNVYHDRHTEGDDYSNRLTLMKDDVGDMSTFWSVVNNLEISSLRNRDSYHLFHKHVKPVWEDPQNLSGGCWTFRVGKSKALDFFSELASLLVGDELQDAIEPGDRVHGVSYSARMNSALISVWNRSGSNEKSVNRLKEYIVDRLHHELRPTDTKNVYYKKHSEHAGWEEAIKKAGLAKEKDEKAAQE